MKQSFISILQKLHCGEKFIEIHGNVKSIEREYDAGWYRIIDDSFIKNAFAFGHGTLEDLKKHAAMNRQYCTIIDLQTGTIL